MREERTLINGRIAVKIGWYFDGEPPMGCGELRMSITKPEYVGRRLGFLRPYILFDNEGQPSLYAYQERLRSLTADDVSLPDEERFDFFPVQLYPEKHIDPIVIDGTKIKGCYWVPTNDHFSDHEWFESMTIGEQEELLAKNGVNSFTELAAKYTLEDYKLFKDYCEERYHMMGCIATVYLNEPGVAVLLKQIGSDSVWGIESNSPEEYLDSVERDLIAGAIADAKEVVAVLAVEKDVIDEDLSKILLDF